MYRRWNTTGKSLNGRGEVVNLSVGGDSSRRIPVFRRTIGDWSRLLQRSSEKIHNLGAWGPGDNAPRLRSRGVFLGFL